MINIDFDLELEGVAERLYETSEDTLIDDGSRVAAEQARKEIGINFDVGGRPAWPLTQDGRVPLQGTGRLRKGCTEDAEVTLRDEGFDLDPDPDVQVVADVQDERYGIFVLPEEAEVAVAEAFEKGLLED
jgi:hypothetical protein